MYILNILPKNEKQKISHCPNSFRFRRKIFERGKMDIPSTHTHDHSLSWLGTGSSITKYIIDMEVKF
jgi:hypothetical protein